MSRKTIIIAVAGILAFIVVGALGAWGTMWLNPPAGEVEELQSPFEAAPQAE